MKLTIPVEQVRVGDIDPETGKAVREILHRHDVMVRKDYARCILAGGWPMIDGYFGEMVTVEREATK